MGGDEEKGRPAEGEQPPDAACIVCGGRTEQRKCKIICLNCGYTRDCSDP